MGSGRSGPYGKSQPYAAAYHVEKSMHQKDIEAGIYHDGHYDVNPTAQNLNDMIKGNYIGDKIAGYDTNSGHFKPNSKSMPYSIPMTRRRIKRTLPEITFKKGSFVSLSRPYLRCHKLMTIHYPSAFAEDLLSICCQQAIFCQI